MLSLARLTPRSASRPALRFACRRLSSSAPVRRSALITGSARGIGRAIALRLASDGFDICVSDLPSNVESIDSVVNEVRDLGREAFGALCDVTKMSQVEEAVQKSVEALGPLDVMVANAGIVQIQPLVDITPEEMQKIYEQGAGGKIINAASIAAFRGDPPGGLYCSTKAAVRSLTQGFAQEYGPHKITVNAYAPGVIDTKMLEKIEVDVAKLTGSQVGDVSKSMEKTTALRRNGNADDVSRLVSFLAGPDSNFITGQTMIVDGGRVFS
ncbi:hypothetical protein PQX77_018614 [Marasmius sp. AFHP31]|nr:hypothetical protein PQX77_018614 [Marasmius sp. AFHP31]